MCSVFNSSLCYHLSHLELKGKIYEQRLLVPVADPDLQIREGGGVVSPPPPKKKWGVEGRGLWVSVWSKHEGEARPPGPLPWIRHWILKGKEEKSSIKTAYLTHSSKMHGVPKNSLSYMKTPPFPRTSHSDWSWVVSDFKEQNTNGRKAYRTRVELKRTAAIM